MCLGAGEPVEDEPVRRIVFGDALAEHGDGDLVGDVAAGGHDLVDLVPEVGASRDVVPEHRASRDVGDAETLRNVCRLSPLAGPGWPDEEQPHAAPIM